MNRAINSAIMGMFCVSCIIMGLVVGYTLTPPNPHIFRYVIDHPQTILLTVTVQDTLDVDVWVNGSASHTLHLTNYLARYDYSNFSHVYQKLPMGYWFFNHTFYDTCQVEYFLY